ncbi:MAG TPA: DUF4242 domain-containing protein [Actinomycetes bacterium]
MPLFMDIHEHLPEGATAADVADAHSADLRVQADYEVHYLKYWVDDAAGKVFCLVDAPDPESAARVHREAHGLVADRIFPVKEGSQPGRRTVQTAGAGLTPSTDHAEPNPGRKPCPSSSVPWRWRPCWGP